MTTAFILELFGRGQVTLLAQGADPIGIAPDQRLHLRRAVFAEGGGIFVQQNQILSHESTPSQWLGGQNTCPLRSDDELSAPKSTRSGRIKIDTVHPCTASMQDRREVPFPAILEATASGWRGKPSSVVHASGC